MVDSSTTVAELRESVRRGAVGYLNKPFEADEVTSLVDRILSLKGD